MISSYAPQSSSYTGLTIASDVSAACSEASLLSTSSSAVTLIGPRTILAQPDSDDAQSAKRRKVHECPQPPENIQSVSSEGSLPFIAYRLDAGLLDGGLANAEPIFERPDAKRKNLLLALTINLLDTYEAIRKKRIAKLELKPQLEKQKSSKLIDQSDFQKAGYRVHKKLGSGGFGTVYKISDLIEKNPNVFYAAKISKQVPDDLESQKYFAKSQRIEASILKSLSAADKVGRAHIVPIIKSFEMDTNVNCIIMELMKSDLLAFAKESNFSFDIRQLKQMTFQLVDSLAFLSSHGIIHADLKPENILVKNKIDLRIADFGTSFTDNWNYDFVQSRYYRAPEVAARYKTFTPKIDMWSLGCILFEIFTGQILFDSKNADTDSLEDCNHLVSQSRILGQNPHLSKGTLFNNLEHPLGPRDYEKRAFDYITSPRKNIFDAHISKAKQRPLDQEELSFADLIKKMLDFNPESRISPEEALRHPFILELAVSCDGILASKASIEESVAVPVSSSSSQSPTTTSSSSSQSPTTTSSSSSQSPTTTSSSNSG